MTFGPQLAEVASLVGDPARANILATDARARLDRPELAHAAHVSPQTASPHLAKLTTAALLRVEKQGRHRYFRLASPMVAKMLEAVMAVAAEGPPRYRPPSRIDDEMRAARTCYDHFAGRLALRWRMRCSRGSSSSSKATGAKSRRREWPSSTGSGSA